MQTLILSIITNGTGVRTDSVRTGFSRSAKPQKNKNGMETKAKKAKDTEDVEIVYTETSRFHKAGEKSVMRRLPAEKLIQQGFAKKA